MCQKQVAACGHTSPSLLTRRIPKGGRCGGRGEQELPGPSRPPRSPGASSPFRATPSCHSGHVERVPSPPPNSITDTVYQLTPLCASPASKASSEDGHLCHCPLCAWQQLVAPRGGSQHPEGPHLSGTPISGPLLSMRKTKATLPTPASVHGIISTHGYLFEHIVDIPSLQPTFVSSFLILLVLPLRLWFI